MKVKILHGFSKYAKVTSHKNQLTLNDPIMMSALSFYVAM